jgi:chemotaxis signal transduction protein
MPDNSSDRGRTRTAQVTNARAVMAYLDALLHEATSNDGNIGAQANTEHPSLARPVNATAEMFAQGAGQAKLDSVLPCVAARLSDRQAWAQPAWAQQRFDCLVFTVNGLKLAIPLRMLSTIHRVDQNITPLFDQPSWLLGLLPMHNGRQIRVVDTGLMIMPERSQPDTHAWVRFAIGVHDSDWAFAAQSIHGSISLIHDAVKWRTQRTSRPWLAGTVISEMCALLDPDAFAQLVCG